MATEPIKEEEVEIYGEVAGEEEKVEKKEGEK